MTKTEKLLLALNNAPEKSLRHGDARQAGKFTIRGYSRARQSLIDRRMLAWTEDCNGIQLTFRGMQEARKLEVKP